jgi:hypothetical protein
MLRVHSEDCKQQITAKQQSVSVAADEVKAAVKNVDDSSSLAATVNDNMTKAAVHTPQCTPVAMRCIVSDLCRSLIARHALLLLPRL